MEQQPLVSVIINCYNGEKYLREAIDSVIAQTYTNWEIIFWDNQSTDSTAEIVKSYKDERIRYFYAPEHTPLGEARNCAMDKVSGVFFSFLDADDVWFPDFLSRGIFELTSSTSLVGYYSAFYICDRGAKHVNSNNKTGEQTLRQIISSYYIGMSACILRTVSVKENDVRFNNDYNLIEDYDFFIRLSFYGNFFFDSKPLMNYRVHNSTSVKLRGQWYDEYLRFYDHCCASYLSKDIIEEDDLLQLKQNIIESRFDSLVEENRKGELFLHLLKNPYFIKSQWKKILMIIFGKSFYDRVKLIFSKLED